MRQETGLAATRDSYRTDDGSFVGATLEEAAAWAKGHPVTWSETTIWWHRDDDAEATDVDRDIRDIHLSERENAKTPDQVNAEAIRLLKEYVDREILKLRMEVSLAMERKE